MATQFTPVEGNPFSKKKEVTQLESSQPTFSIQPTFSGGEPQEMDQELHLPHLKNLKQFLK